MPTIAYHNVPGTIGFATRPAPIQKSTRHAADRSPAWMPSSADQPEGDQPQGQDGAEGEENEPIEIHLGPLPPPPMPLGVVIGSDVNRNRSSSDRFRIRLDKAFKQGRIDSEVLKQIRNAALATPQSEAFEIDAELPLHRMINVDVLSRHVSGIGTEIGRKVAMRLAAPQPEK